jgi:uncharacterized membrane protein HdeD (DUF308 family)
MSRPSQWWQLTLFMGVVMLAIGAFLGLRPAFGGRRPLLGAWWLDVVAAIVFLVRGLMNVRQATLRRRLAP